MRCEDVLRFLSPYIDSALDPRTSFEVAEHLEGCPDCARRFGAEIALEGDLRAGLARDMTRPGDAAVWEPIEAAIRREAAPRRVTRRWVVAAFVAASIALVAVIGWRLRGGEAPLGTMGKSACHSHDGYLDGSERAELATGAPTEVTAFFRAQLGLEVHPPPGLTLVGARRCAFGSVQVAYLMGHREGEPVSAFVLPAASLGAFPEALAALERGEGRAQVSLHGHAVTLVRGPELAACVVASPRAGPLEPIALAIVGQ